MNSWFHFDLMNSWFHFDLMNASFRYICLVCFWGAWQVTAQNGSDTRAALLIVDVQECFLPGGSLAVENATAIVPVINRMRENKFDLVVFSMDWHPAGHVSFASTHRKQSFESVPLNYLQNGTLCRNGTINLTNFPSAVQCGNGPVTTLYQKLWPDHCVQNVSSGPTSSRIYPQLVRHPDDVIVFKGTHVEIDSYSAFLDNGKFYQTSLHDRLRASDINTVFIAGLALDICVFYTSLHARELGYTTYTVMDASLGIDPQHVKDAEKKLVEAGAHLIKHTEIPSLLQGKNNQATKSVKFSTLILLLLQGVGFMLVALLH